MAMLVSVAGRIRLWYGRLKKFDFVGAADALALRLKKRQIVTLEGRSKRFMARRRAAIRMGIDPDTYQNGAWSGRSFASSSWLEYTYGIQPLYQDIYGAMKAMTDYHLGKPPIMMVRGKASFTGGKETKFPSYPSNGITNVCETTTEVKVMYQYIVHDFPQSTITSLGLTNPINLVWELTPLSFVFDWWSPIGDYLSSIDAARGKTYQRGLYSAYQISVGKLLQSWKFSQATGGVSVWPPHHAAYSGSTQSKSGNTGKTHRRYTRQLQGPPNFIQTASALVPLFNGFGVKKAISAVALVQQQLLS